MQVVPAVEGGEGDREHGLVPHKFRVTCMRMGGEQEGPEEEVISVRVPCPAAVWLLHSEVRLLLLFFATPAAGERRSWTWSASRAPARATSILVPMCTQRATRTWSPGSPPC